MVKEIEGGHGSNCIKAANSKRRHCEERRPRSDPDLKHAAGNRFTSTLGYDVSDAHAARGECPGDQQTAMAVKRIAFRTHQAQSPPPGVCKQVIETGPEARPLRASSVGKTHTIPRSAPTRLRGSGFFAAMELATITQLRWPRSRSRKSGP